MTVKTASVRRGDELREESTLVPLLTPGISNGSEPGPSTPMAPFALNCCGVSFSVCGISEGNCMVSCVPSYESADFPPSLPFGTRRGEAAAAAISSCSLRLLSRSSAVSSVNRNEFPPPVTVSNIDAFGWPRCLRGEFSIFINTESVCLFSIFLCCNKTM